MSDNFIGLLIISLVAAIVILSLGSYIGYNKGRQDTYAEAVKLNIGEWVIMTDGKPEFRFKK